MLGINLLEFVYCSHPLTFFTSNIQGLKSNENFQARRQWPDSVTHPSKIYDPEYEVSRYMNSYQLLSRLLTNNMSVTFYSYSEFFLLFHRLN